MSEPFMAQISIFAGNFAPRSWAFCDGQLLPISQNQALFSLLGTTYGGDPPGAGQTTFALPDLRDRAPVHPGPGPGLSTRTLGEKGGAETTALTAEQIASHTHTLLASTTSATGGTPTAGASLAEAQGGKPYGSAESLGAMDASAIDARWSLDAPHNNMQPFLAVNFIIALQGLYPSRNY